MKASQFTDAQKAFILKQGAEGLPVAEICRKAGISQVRRVTNTLRREMKRRAAVEPVIGHMKPEHRMHRNHLKVATAIVQLL